MSTKINPTKINFGVPAAERDTLLSDYFVESESFRHLLDGNKFIALGNRGSGKTAIFEIIAEKAKQRKHSTVKVSPEEYSYEILSKYMAAEAEGAWRKQSAYSAAWKYVLYVLAMKQIIGNDTKSYKRGDEAKIYNYLRDNHTNFDLNPMGVLVSYLKRIEALKIGNFEVGLKVRELDALYKLEEINNLLPALERIAAKHPVLILVDELDRGWDASEDSKAFVAGLFEASVSINNKMKNNIRVLMSLRKELYNSIPSMYDDAQKYRDIIETIEWDEDSLRELIAKRILVSFPDLAELSDEEIWNLAFPETLEYRQTKSFKYVVDRTLYRPREIIEFCKTIQDTAVKRHTEVFSYDIVSDAEAKYSEARLKDIAAEYKFQYPGLENVFETFRGLFYNFERDALEYHCLRIVEGDINVRNAGSWCSEITENDLIQILWDVGFLRAYAIGGIKSLRYSGSGYVGSHQITSLPLMNITRFQVHQMFRTYLSMKEGSQT